MATTQDVARVIKLARTESDLAREWMGKAAQPEAPKPFVRPALRAAQPIAPLALKVFCVVFVIGAALLYSLAI